MAAGFADGRSAGPEAEAAVDAQSGAARRGHRGRLVP